jgi:multiple antibiotic resistance protein
MDTLSELFSSTIKIFALMAPPAVLSAFLSGTRSYDKERKRRTALRTGSAVFIIGVILYLLGEKIFDIFGFTLDAFRIGAGALLFLCAVSLMNEKPSDQTTMVHDDDDISVVPLAIPLCMGPATIGTVILLGASAEWFTEKALGVLSLCIASFGIYVTLLFADKIAKVLKRTGLTVLSKLTGMLLAAIAAQVIFTGIGSFLK